MAEEEAHDEGQAADDVVSHQDTVREHCIATDRKKAAGISAGLRIVAELVGAHTQIWVADYNPYMGPEAVAGIR